MFEVTNSEIEMFKSCRYKWFLNYIKLITSKKPVKAFEDGTVFHSALENLGLGVGIGEVIGIIKQDYKDLIDNYPYDVTQEILNDYEHRKNVIQALVIGYHFHYKDTEDWEVLDTEMEFSYEIVKKRPKISFRKRGKKDKLVEKDKKEWIVEHKSAAKLAASYIGSIDMKPQPLSYLLEDSINNDKPVEGLIFDVAKKTSFKLLSGETSEEFIARVLKDYENKPEKSFYREEIRVSKKQLNAFKKDVIKVVAQMIECADKPKQKVYRQENHCYQYGPCPYLQICRKKSIHGEHMKDFYVRDKKHMELKT